ncbi:phosphocholine-specific phospholipase C [Pinibacter soli]|uniref:phospholipase C n=1 Tax=Pinibacter soli TaxID=3044211 RepID=A0ABT6RFB6_9BACT|nr:phospholipase C, phosphocholine-specific [Pinibacter soli]MDI3321244.1 phospholipase C, phosphocholine-specific [Pinibacter soli]
MENRREFIKKAGLLSGLMGMNTLIPAAVQRALAIEAAPGTTWKDAEHVVILMQENRSFDHTYGTLRGVRGYNDPRAIRLANNNPVWLQSNSAGNTYAPFRLDLKNTKATWMSSLPHSWNNQINARNDGKYDQWLNVKKNGIKEYSDMPLTLGYYTREDIPFYYALADGFTVCDQHFCSSLTGTSPNRLYFWAGTIRAEQNEDSRALVWNDDMDFETLNFRTFPELLEDNNVSWKFYQNEVAVNVGFEGHEEAWLSNFGDNPLEYFSQYNVKLHEKHLAYLKKVTDTFPKQIADLQTQLASLSAVDVAAKKLQKTIENKQRTLKQCTTELEVKNHEMLGKLSPREKALQQKAFTTNTNDPHYHSLESVTYSDNGVERTMQVPKGDLLYQFREDVKRGNLPMVSWIAAPEHLSDHPSSAWYGAWYVSEVMDILTQNPEVWKKTIFILTYDENDGYFDHVPPFVAPHSDRPETGMASRGMDTKVEFVTKKQLTARNGFPEPANRESAIGLGYRVPLVIASPWTRGGYVNSEVFDHTSTIQFLEKFVKAKSGKDIHESNISDWRRTVCGDLTSVFRPSNTNDSPGIDYVVMRPFLEQVYNAQFKKLPDSFKSLTAEEIKAIQKDPHASEYMPKQEKGVKPASALNYELYADGYLNAARDAFVMQLKAGNQAFGADALGSPFNVYRPGKDLQTWAFAVKAADQLERNWSLKDFENGKYHLCVYGPNGFFREFKGSANDPAIAVECRYEKSGNKNKLTGNIALILNNTSQTPYKIRITDNAYKTADIEKTVQPKGKLILPIELSKQHGWYDFSVTVEGDEIFEKRYAGKVETGVAGFTDPFMGGEV